MTNSDVKLYHHGRFALAGGTLPNAFTAYQTYGDPENPCIVSTTCFGGRVGNTGPFSNMWQIGKGKVGSTLAGGAIGTDFVDSLSIPTSISS